jgi:DnaK suppressor protein
MATTKTVKKTAQETSPSAPKIVTEPKVPVKAGPAKNEEATAAASAKSVPKAPAKAPVKKDDDPELQTDIVPVEMPEVAPVVSVIPPAAVPAPGGKWKEVQQILLAMKEQTLLEIKRSIKKGSEASVGAEPTGDIYDQASSERDRELGLLLNDREREKVHSIDEALLRIAEGEYGICEECDEEIPMGRLKVLPFTRHCVKCKSDLEKFQAQTRRIEEDRAYREIPVGDDDEG